MSALAHLTRLQSLPHCHWVMCIIYYNIVIPVMISPSMVSALSPIFLCSCGERPALLLAVSQSAIYCMNSFSSHWVYTIVLYVSEITYCHCIPSACFHWVMCMVLDQVFSSDNHLINFGHLGNQRICRICGQSTVFLWLLGRQRKNSRPGII